MTSECEHKHFRNIESCPYCDLNEAEQALAAAHALLSECREAIRRAERGYVIIDALRNSGLLRRIDAELQQARSEPTVTNRAGESTRK